MLLTLVAKHAIIQLTIKTNCILFYQLPHVAAETVCSSRSNRMQILETWKTIWKKWWSSGGGPWIRLPILLKHALKPCHMSLQNDTEALPQRGPLLIRSWWSSFAKPKQTLFISCLVTLRSTPKLSENCFLHRSGYLYRKLIPSRKTRSSCCGFTPSIFGTCSLSTARNSRFPAPCETPTAFQGLHWCSVWGWLL